MQGQAPRAGSRIVAVTESVLVGFDLSPAPLVLPFLPFPDPNSRWGLGRAGVQTTPREEGAKEGTGHRRTCPTDSVPLTRSVSNGELRVVVAPATQAPPGYWRPRVVCEATSRRRPFLGERRKPPVRAPSRPRIRARDDPCARAGRQSPPRSGSGGPMGATTSPSRGWRWCSPRDGPRASNGRSDDRSVAPMRAKGSRGRLRTLVLPVASNRRGSRGSGHSSNPRRRPCCQTPAVRAPLGAPGLDRARAGRHSIGKLHLVASLGQP